MTATEAWGQEHFDFLYGRGREAARSVAREFPTVDIEDLTQEAVMWAVEHPKKVVEWLEHDEGVGRLIVAMKNSLRRYAVRERALQRGDETQTDDHWYSLEVLKGFGRGNGQRGLLHLVFEQEAWLGPEVTSDDPGVRTKRDPAEGGNWLATLSDVSSALDKLSKDDPKAWALLVLHYKQQYTYEEIGPQLTPPVSRAEVSRRVDRAARKLQDLLGGPEPREDPPEDGWENGLVGTRRAISNSHARALTSHGYADD